MRLQPQPSAAVYNVKNNVFHSLTKYIILVRFSASCTRPLDMVPPGQCHRHIALRQCHPTRLREKTSLKDPMIS